MSVYNVKCIGYKDSTQVRIFSRPIYSQENNQPKSPNVWTVDGKPKTKVEEKPERTQKQIKHSEVSSVNRTVNNIYSISRSNRWEYFITLTINPKLLDSTDYDLILNKLNIWTNNLKKRYSPNLKYIIVPELHKDKSKWHFHGLFSDIGNMPLSFSGKVCVGKYTYDYARKPYANKIYNLPLWKYGFSTATPIRDSARSGSYITKYVTKDLTQALKDKHRYLSSQNCDKPVEFVYNVDYETLNDFLNQNLQHADYFKTVKVSDAGQQIIYMEFNKKE